VATLVEQQQALPPTAERPHPEDELKKTWTDPQTFIGWFSTVQNGPIVYRLMTTVFIYFLLGGVEAIVMRTQLARPENTLLSPQLYDGLLTMHGSTMIFLFATPMMEAFAEFLLPVTLGARELPFPRMTAFLYWVLLFGGVMFNGAFLVGQLPQAGWFAYTPLSNITFSPDLGIDFWLLGLDVAQIAAIGDVFELGTAILRMRAPGMSLARMPIYLWSILVMAFMMLFGFTPLFMVTGMLQLDRHWGTHFFDPSAGGDPLLWQHLFWIFGHPDVYIMFIPASGLISLIIPTFARRPMVGHTLIVLAMVGTGFMSFGLWVHHMFATGLPWLDMTFFTAASLMISIFSGIQILAFIATLVTGRLHFQTPMLFALGFIIIFVLGGLTGVMLGVVPFDLQVTDTFFVVAHFHYVLIGGVLFPTFAALYYWMPKLVGRALGEGLGKVSFWLMFVGFNVAFFPMHISGLLGMPRRVYTFSPGLGLEVPNLVSSIGAYVLGLGVLASLVNFVDSVYLGHGEKTNDNPWRAGTLDWATASPPPDEGYRVQPIVHSREPLWDQERLDQGPPEWVSLVRALETYPVKWRASLVTTLTEGAPEGIVRLAGPSVLPFLAAVCIAVVFGAELYNVHPLAILATLGAILVVVIWMWPERIEREFRLDDAGRPTIYGLPVYLAGPRAPGWWGMTFVILVMAVGSACLIFSYFYLAVRNPAWPGAATPTPGVLLALVNLGVLAALAGCLRWALAAVRGGGRTGLLLGTALSLVLGVVSLVVQGIDMTGWGWTPDTNAYTSAFGTLIGIQVVFVTLGLMMAGSVALQAWLGYFNRWRHLAIENLANYWLFVAAHWLLLVVVLYVSPHLL
jgi:cytochrome c oxidase subunit I+III